MDGHTNGDGEAVNSSKYANAPDKKKIPIIIIAFLVG
jgi:hypothetical protein